MAYALMIGNPIDGFRAYGPLDDCENPVLEARVERDWLDSGATWWYIPLQPVHDDEKGEQE